MRAAHLPSLLAPLKCRGVPGGATSAIIDAELVAVDRSDGNRLVLLLPTAPLATPCVLDPVLHVLAPGLSCVAALAWPPNCLRMWLPTWWLPACVASCSLPAG